jgi:catechol 2,3-dioxygenase-like lactoylglutathione lyase family enzyme
MGFHHVALACRDTAATHRFYTEVMGFELAKVVAAPTPTGGWSKHFFYSTGTSPSGEQGMMAFWEIHDDTIGGEFATNINKATGLPWWVNHIAFDAPTIDDLHRHRDQWRAHGHTVLEVNHEFCISIYIRDPDGNMVEFCHTVREFTGDERRRALDLVTNANPELDHGEYPAIVHEPLQPA